MADRINLASYKKMLQHLKAMTPRDFENFCDMFGMTKTMRSGLISKVEQGIAVLEERLLKEEMEHP